MKGTGVSPGISIGTALVLQEKAVLSGAIINEEAIPEEVEKFDNAVARSVSEIIEIRDRRSLQLKEADILILEAQIELLTDPQIREDVAARISSHKIPAADALIHVVAEVMEVFRNMEDEYLRARAADVQDAGNRILKNLRPTLAAEFATGKDTILVTEEMAPSDTLSLDLTQVIAFITVAGGKTSHAAIIAKSRGLPAVVGGGEALKGIRTGDLLIVDGSEGTIIVNPPQETIDAYIVKQESYREYALLLGSLKDRKAVTMDGTKIELLANISSPDDLEQAFENGAEGSGLFRTEMLFMDRDNFPGEDEQFEWYKKAALKAGGRPVTIRTIDIGGDKDLHYFTLEKEANPFLGYRAIRICLDRKDIFITQLKAILRAAVFGELRIMFPMISGVEELIAAKQVLQEAREMLATEKKACAGKIKVGIMIEIPSAAITADVLAREADFFSIGTNDLCQYTLAVDRMNQKIKDLYDPFHPAVLRLIRQVIGEGARQGIPVGMCGEMASDPMAALLLIGLGLDELSMSAVSIPAIKNIVLNNTLQAAREISENVMQMNHAHEIREYLKKQLL